MSLRISLDLVLALDNTSVAVLVRVGRSGNVDRLVGRVCLLCLTPWMKDFLLSPKDDDKYSRSSNDLLFSLVISSSELSDDVRNILLLKNPPRVSSKA